MKINITQIAQEGLTLEEEIPFKVLELETDAIKFRSPVKVKAAISKITNAVSVDLDIAARFYAECSRCLNEIEVGLKKRLKLSYQVSNVDRFIDISQDIREEVILDYPIKPLCKPDCRGICPECGNNLNDGDCDCIAKGAKGGAT